MRCAAARYLQWRRSIPPSARGEQAVRLADGPDVIAVVPSPRYRCLFVFTLLAMMPVFPPALCRGFAPRPKLAGVVPSLSIPTGRPRCKEYVAESLMAVTAFSLPCVKLELRPYPKHTGCIRDRIFCEYAVARVLSCLYLLCLERSAMAVQRLEGGTRRVPSHQGPVVHGSVLVWLNIIHGAPDQMWDSWQCQPVSPSLHIQPPRRLH